jgi:hypothetical protein
METEGSLPRLQVPVPILSQINPVHAPHPNYWRSILTLYSHQRLVFPSGPFPSGSPPKPCTHFAPIRAIRSAPHILLDLIKRILFSEEYKTLRSSFWSFLHSPVTLYLLGPNILLSTVFSNTLSLHPSLNVSDQVSHPYKQADKIIVLYILIWGPRRHSG